MLLMVVFKQARSAKGTGPCVKNKRAGSMNEDARQGPPAQEGMKVEGKPS